jgi:hypothetical protein
LTSLSVKLLRGWKKIVKRRISHALDNCCSVICSLAAWRLRIQI